MKKVLVVALLIFVIISNAQAQNRNDFSAYFLAIFLGFGSGHWYCAGTAIRTLPAAGQPAPSERLMGRPGQHIGIPQGQRTCKTDQGTHHAHPAMAGSRIASTHHAGPGTGGIHHNFRLRRRTRGTGREPTARRADSRTAQRAQPAGAGRTFAKKAQEPAGSGSRAA